MGNFHFFITRISRPADHYVGCCDGSVYIDFNNREDGTVCLARISFDGYGCCNLGQEGIPIDKERSKIFKEMIRTGDVDQHKMERIVKEAIALNRSLIWKDALEEYELI